MYTPINQYIERLENISFDVAELNNAVSRLTENKTVRKHKS